MVNSLVSQMANPQKRVVGFENIVFAHSEHTLSEEAEAALIGSALIDPYELPQVTSIVDASAGQDHA